METPYASGGRRSAARSAKPVVGAASGAALPLWLSEPEAERLVSLCLASLGYAGEVEEHALFSKLGAYLRAFRGRPDTAEPADLAA